jgi:hypothetical protein
MSTMLYMAEDSAPATAVPDGETVILPDAARTQAAEWAWSETEEFEEPQVSSWRLVWGNATVFILVGVVLAGVIGVVGWVSWRSNRPEPPLPAKAVTTTVVTVTVPAPAPPSPTPIKELTPDEQYILGLQRAGIQITNRQNAITTGHSVCTMRGGGMTYTDIGVSIQRNNPGMSPQMVDESVVAAVGAYCPALAGAN